MSLQRIGWLVAGSLLLIGAVALPVVVESARLLYLVVGCLVLPGAGWAYRWGAGDLGDRVALTLAVSMAATILVSTAMAASGTWNLTGGLAALAVIAVLGFVPFRQARAAATTAPGTAPGTRRGGAGRDGPVA